MNDAKSVPSTHIRAVKKSKYTPQVTKKPAIHANNVKFTNHSLFRTMVNGTLKIYSELRKICPIHRPLSRTMQNSHNLHSFLNVLYTQW